MFEIYSAEIWPFAQRTRAVLTHLDHDFKLHEIDLGNKPDEFVEKSPTGKVPLLVEGEYVLYESEIINDFLVDRLNWDNAYPEGLNLKYQQKVCMRQWDSVILGPFYRSLSDTKALLDNEEEIRSELNFLSTIVSKSGTDTVSLFGFHFAPFWARMTWLKQYSPFTGWVRDSEPLGRWLDQTLENPAIQHTLPDRDWAIEQYTENYV